MFTLACTSGGSDISPSSSTLTSLPRSTCMFMYGEGPCVLVSTVRVVCGVARRRSPVAAAVAVVGAAMAVGCHLHFLLVGSPPPRSFPVASPSPPTMAPRGRSVRRYSGRSRLRSFFMCAPRIRLTSLCFLAARAQNIHHATFALLGIRFGMDRIRSNQTGEH